MSETLFISMMAIAVMVCVGVVFGFVLAVADKNSLWKRTLSSRK